MGKHPATLGKFSQQWPGAAELDRLKVVNAELVEALEGAAHSMNSAVLDCLNAGVPRQQTAFILQHAAERLCTVLAKARE